MRWILFCMATVAAGCGMPNANGQCSDYTPWIQSCSDGFVEVCDNSSGCEQCSCVSADDIGPSRPNQDAKRN
ncbi:MAG: hypothetical protein R3E66_23810 [bacterium]